MCYPTGCPCCVCNGKMCLMWHPGHNHDMDRIEEYLTKQDDAFLKTVEQTTPGPLPEHDDMA